MEPDDPYAPLELADGTLYPLDFYEYWRAIEAAPPGTMIKMGDRVTPIPWMRCTECGAEMDEALTPHHVHA